MSVQRWRAIGRAVIGFGFVVVGAARQLDPRTFPVDDYRNDPTTRALINGVVILAGALLILSALIPFLRGQRSR